jgi:hypothetical protein
MIHMFNNPNNEHVQLEMLLASDSVSWYYLVHPKKIQY